MKETPVVVVPKPVAKSKRGKSLIPTRVQPSQAKKTSAVTTNTGTKYRPICNPETVPDRPQRKKSKNYAELTNLAMAFKTIESPASVTFEGAPRNLDEAMKRPDWPQFRAATIEEPTQLQEMGTWSTTSFPPQRKAI